MNKNLTRFLASCLLVSIMIYGCNGIRGKGNTETETREVPSFEAIAVSGSMDVHITPGPEIKVKVSDYGNLLPYLITEVEDNTLRIHYKNNVSIYDGEAEVFITMPSVREIRLSGSGDIESTGVLKNSGPMALRLTGSGDMDLRIDAPNVTISCVGSGDMEVSGMTRTLECSLSGSGDIDCSDLKAEEVRVKSSGSGDVRVFASRMLNVRTAGSGNVTYGGNPENPEIHITGSGSVKKVDRD